MVLTHQLDTDLLLLITLKMHLVPPTESISLWCGHYCCSDLTWKVVDLLSGPIKTFKMEFGFEGLDRLASTFATTFVRIIICSCPLHLYWPPSRWRIFTTQGDWNGSDAEWWRCFSNVHHPFQPPGKVGTSGKYMHGNNVNDDKEGVGLPPAYAVAASMEPKHDGRQITTPDFVQEQANDLFCWQASFTVGLLGSTYNYNKNGFWRVLHQLLV